MLNNTVPPAPVNIVPIYLIKNTYINIPINAAIKLPIGAAIDTSWVDDEVYGVDAFIVSCNSA